MIAAACLGAASGVAVHTLRPPPPATVPVVVLARDVRAGAALAPADLTLADVPPQAAPRDALREPADARDRVPAIDLPAGLPLSPGLLTDGALTGPPGTVVVAVRLDDPTVAELLEPGARLDLVAARLEGGPGETTARRALVLPRPEAAATGGGLLAGAAAPGEGAPLLVAVTPDEALRIAETSASSRLVAVVVP